MLDGTSSSSDHHGVVVWEVEEISMAGGDWERIDGHSFSTGDISSTVRADSLMPDTLYSFRARATTYDRLGNKGCGHWVELTQVKTKPIPENGGAAAAEGSVVRKSRSGKRKKEEEENAAEAPVVIDVSADEAVDGAAAMGTPEAQDDDICDNDNEDGDENGEGDDGDDQSDDQSAYQTGTKRQKAGNEGNVSAAATDYGGGGGGGGGGGSGGGHDMDEEEPINCMCCDDNFSDVIYVPCGHMTSCAACNDSSGGKLKPLEQGCFMCKQNVADLKQVSVDECGPLERRTKCVAGLDGCTGKADTLFLPCKCFNHCGNCSKTMKRCVTCRRKKETFVTVYE
jgi:hypothetical protein